MAKAKETVKPETKAAPKAAPVKAPAKEVAVKKDLNALAHRATSAAAVVSAESGANVSFISLCQKTAHALTEDDKLYIDGIKVKDFYIQSKKLVLGRKLKVVPLAFISMYNEITSDKVPKFLGIWHKDDALGYDLAVGSFFNRQLPSGNLLQPVTWVPVYLPDFPDIKNAVVTFKSTGQKVAKAWRKDTEAEAKSACELIYILSAAAQKNDEGDWIEVAYELEGRVYDIDKAGNITEVNEDYAEDVLTLAAEINESYMKGTLITRRSASSGMRNVSGGRQAKAIEDIIDDDSELDDGEVPAF